MDDWLYSGSPTQKVPAEPKSSLSVCCKLLRQLIVHVHVLVHAHVMIQEGEPFLGSQDFDRTVHTCAKRSLICLFLV